MLGALVVIQVKSSIVLEAPLQDCWRVCRAWGRQPWLPLLPDGTTFDVSILNNRPETEVGAVRRSKFGNSAQIFEKLMACDEDKHTLKWQAVAHEETISPFEEATFANFNTTLTLHAVTMGDKTFCEWEGEVYTEPQFVESLRATMEQWYQFGMLSLKEYMARTRAKQDQVEQSAPSPQRRSGDLYTSREHGPNSRQSERYWYSGRRSPFP